MTGFSSHSTRLIGALIVAAALSLPASIASAQSADTVLFNGKVVTVDKDFLVQQALAIAHGQVLATGSSAAMKKLAGDNARLIDLGGRTVIPGQPTGTFTASAPR
jgi:adenine deaminase